MIFNTVFGGAGPTLYSIDNGSPSVMSIDKASAQAGETVTVTNLTSSALSWKLDGVSQTDIAANGTATFTMPAGNVVVAAVADRHLYLSNCRAMNAANGQTISYGDVVVAGTSLIIISSISDPKVKLTVFYGTPPDNVQWDNVYYGPQDISDGNSAQFTMPDADILASVHPLA